MKLVLQYEAEWDEQRSPSGLVCHLLKIAGVSAFVASTGEHGWRWRLLSLDLSASEKEEFTGLTSDPDRGKEKVEAAVRTYFLNRNELYQ